MASRIFRFGLFALFIVMLIAASGCQDTTKSTTASSENQGNPASPSPANTTANPTPTQLAKAPTASGPSLIAFTAKNGIGISTLDGKTVRQISAGVEDYTPVWSPDGKKIAYKVRSPRDKIGLYVYSLEDNAAKKVADEAGIFMGYSWSSDSKRLAYNNNTTDVMGIYTVDVTTGGSTRLSPKEDTIAEPSWSPDGKWIAFHYTGPSGSGVRIVSPDGGSSREIAGGTFINAPAWSPDSQKVALIDVSRKGNQFDLILASVDGSGTTRLLEGKGNSSQNPKWSPDGKRILYYASVTREKIDYRQLWAVNVDGKNPQLYLETPKMGGTSWSPDGSSLAVSSDKDGLVMVHIISADGYEERAVIEGLSAAWSPPVASASIQQLGKAMPGPAADPRDKGRGYLGVYLIPSDGDLLTKIGQPVREDGLIVAYVLPDSPAKAAGLAPKDLLLRVGKQDIKGADDFEKAIESLKTGDKLAIKYLRGGTEKTTEFTAKQRPANYYLLWNNHKAAVATANPGDSFLFLARGIAEQAADTARSQFYFDRAIELDGNFASAYYWRATNHEYFGKTDQARADLDKASRLTTDKILLDMVKKEMGNLK